MPNILPNAENAVIDSRKLRDYVLNPEHAVGRHKAAFFGAMGYSRDRWQELADDIRSQLITRDAESGSPSPFGRKFTITGPLTGPNNRVVRQVTVVWIFRGDNDYAELVTIEPATRDK